jgi:hypothetical protein
MKYLIFTFFTLALTCQVFAQTLTVKQLYDEQRKNSYNFTNKYRNQKITLNGKIRSISPVTVFWKGEKNYHRVYLTATGYENFVICQIPYEDSAVLKRFNTRDVITVTGIVSPTSGDVVYLNECSFTTSKPIVKNKSTPENAPLGKYNVYQNDAAGFSYQYTMYLKSYSSYTLNGKSGNCAYQAANKSFLFKTGPLKGFAGIYRPFNPSNDQDPPTIVLDVNGRVPDLKSINKGYQYGYYKGS